MQHVPIAEERIQTKAPLPSPTIPINPHLILIPIPIPISFDLLIIRTIETIDERRRERLRKHAIQRLPIEHIPIKADVHLSAVGAITFVPKDVTNGTDWMLEIGTEILVVRDADDDVVRGPKGAVSFGFAGLFAVVDVGGVR